MKLFDQAFPGHYLRLIRRVRTSVVALIPPVEGIRATLRSVGVSYVVVGGDALRPVEVRRDPELVAFTSPSNATGLFELDAQPEMLLPFEGMGVDALWEFQLPRAANFFDYRTIADVLFTIEYTALNSSDYRDQVIQQLDPTVSATRPFSFRNELADQWYDLHNPDQTTKLLVVRFSTRREDFPPNLDGLAIEQVVLYFAHAAEQPFEVIVDHLHFTEQGGSGYVGGGAKITNGVASTAGGTAPNWNLMRGKPPLGEWELALENTPELRQCLQDDVIEDILLVITFGGRRPAWPA
jgi:hypothetical protein